MYTAEDFNILPRPIQDAFHNAADVYTSQLGRSGWFYFGLLYTRTGFQLAMHNRNFQLFNFWNYDPALCYLIPVWPGDQPDPSYPQDMLGMSYVLDQIWAIDNLPDMGLRPAKKVRKSYYTGCARRRRNL